MVGGDGIVEQLLAFEVDEDPGVPLGFRDRLARENGWSRAHAARVYDEYRRFLVLAAIGDQPVTPSDEVDQAWHLHLTYTRSYWEDLCREVLGTPLHHGPTTGSRDDGVRYRDQYAATLARYRDVFGEEPPADIWPGVGERFRDPARWQRVDTGAHVVVRRAPLVAAAGGALGVLALTAGAGNDDSRDVGLFLLGLVVAVVVVVVIVVLLARSSGAGRRRRGGSGCGGGFFFWGDGGGDSGGSDHDSSGGCGGGGGGGDSGGSSGCGGGGGGCGSS